MSTWRQYAERVQRGNDGRDNRDDRDDSPQNGPNGPIVPNVPLDPIRMARAWKAGLESVDPRQPMHGMALGRWHTVCDDAVWLFGNFGQQAARDGWSTADLFGLWPDKPAWGGVSDRLRGSRSLMMTADRACWRDLLTDQPDQYARGVYPDLRPFWESPNG
jgi:hypothetical protein